VRQSTVGPRLTTVAAVLALFFGSGPADASLSEAPRLAAVYDTILAARFDRVDAVLQRVDRRLPEDAVAHHHADGEREEHRDE